jgi:hypothetical protein
VQDPCSFFLNAYKVRYISKMPVTPKVTEQRKSERSSIRRCGWFAKMKGAQPRECVVLDESKSGARVAVDPNELSARFFIYMSLKFRLHPRCQVKRALDGAISTRLPGADFPIFSAT